MQPVNAEYINVDVPFDWASILDSLKDKEGVDITPDPSIWRMEVPAYTEILNIWKEANYKLDSVKWTNYYPGVHYDTGDIDETLCKILNVKLRRSWISRIDPGYSAPWHWDVEDDPEEVGDALRYTVFLGDSKLGHIFILGEEDYFINVKHGTMIKWNRYDEWHIGMNAGLVPKYMYHLKAKRL
jgi:hypothetical protein